MSAEPRRNLLRDASGASALEFAILAPAFIALLFFVIQLGWALHCGSSVRYAMEGAGRSVMMNPAMTQSAVQSQIQAALTGLADPTNVTATLTVDPTGTIPRMAHLGTVYTQRVGVPELATYNMTFRSNVDVPVG